METGSGSPLTTQRSVEASKTLFHQISRTHGRQSVAARAITLEQIKENCSHWVLDMTQLARENTLVGFARTHIGGLRPRGKHSGRSGPPLSRVAGHGQEAPATASAHRPDRSPTPPFRTQAAHRRESSSPTPHALGRKARSDPQGTSCSRRVELFPSRHPLHFGEVGADL